MTKYYAYDKNSVGASVSHQWSPITNIIARESIVARSN